VTGIFVEKFPKIAKLQEGFYRRGAQSILYRTLLERCGRAFPSDARRLMMVAIFVSPYTGLSQIMRDRGDFRIKPRLAVSGDVDNPSVSWFLEPRGVENRQHGNVVAYTHALASLGSPPSRVVRGPKWCCNELFSESQM